MCENSRRNKNNKIRHCKLKVNARSNLSCWRRQWQFVYIWQWRNIYLPAYNLKYISLAPTWIIIQNLLYYVCKIIFYTTISFIYIFFTFAQYLYLHNTIDVWAPHVTVRFWFNRTVKDYTFVLNFSDPFKFFLEIDKKYQFKYVEKSKDLINFSM